MNFRNNLISYRHLPIVVFLASITIAAFGISHDLPFVGNSIEEQSIAASFRLFIEPNFNDPCCLTYPPLYFYLTAGITWIIYSLGSLIGIINNKQIFIGQMLLDPSLLTITFRILSIISYALSGLFLFLTGRNIFSLKEGIIAIFLFLFT
jgi:hypothetical protein